MTSEPTLAHNPFELERLEQLAAALREAKAWEAQNGLFFYRPHWKQHLFHTCPAKGRYGRTGNRFGKSEMGMAEDLSILRGERVWYKHSFDILDGERNVRLRHEGSEDHPFVRLGMPGHPVKGLLLVVDWDMAKSIFTNQTDDPKTCGKLWRLLPKDWFIDRQLSRGGHIERVFVRHVNGGVSTLKIDTIESWKHNKLSSESDDFDFIHVDEPVPEEMFKGYARGLMDRNGRFHFTCTPLDQMWINDEFSLPGRANINNAPEGQLFYKDEKKMASRYIITGSIYDNPHRNDAGVADFEASLSREERSCRLMGLPLNLAGLIYKEFIYDLHVLPDVPKGWAAYNDPPKDYTVRVAWDVHDAIPQAILLVATAPTGEAFVYDEMWIDKSIGINAEVLKERLKGRNVVDYWIDPRAVIESPVTGESILDVLMEHGFYFEKGSKDMHTGISKTREKLAERNANGFPTIWFCPTAERCIWEMMRYAYDKNQKPVDKDDHMLENLRRLVLGGLSYVEPTMDNVLKFRKTTTIGFDEDTRPIRKRTFAQ